MRCLLIVEYIIQHYPPPKKKNSLRHNVLREKSFIRIIILRQQIKAWADRFIVIPLLSAKIDAWLI